MKKPLTASTIKKKSKTENKLKIKNSPFKSIPKTKAEEDKIKTLFNQLKAELLDKIDQKFNTFNHRFDRVEDGIEEVLDELRAAEALLESESEPYEGQA